MLDVFDRPDGNLVGSVASSGQTWATKAGPAPTMLVRGRTAVGVVNEESGAQVNSAFSAPQFAGDWWARCVFRFPVLAAGANAFGCWLGEETLGPYAGVVVQPTGGSGADLTGGNILAGDLGTHVDTCFPDADHEIVFAFEAAGGNVRLIFDDVVVASASGYVLDPGTVLVFQVAELLDVTAVVVPMLEVELATGVYPG